ncbi:YkgJ family cysteine cluster protein [Haloferula sp.]|uniref:YkgJ family cysteine cluster protein n=1 Tax=Haloferula sp. TaxID=2497595 RepID=UPI003C731CDD
MSAEHGSPGNREVYLDPDTFYVCQRCTKCCKWPGDVRLEDDEVSRIAGYLGMSEAAFLEKYTRLRTNRQGLSLIEKDNHECIMLKKGGCRIHEVKPAQCAGFPNKWNFPDWQKECEAAPMPMEEARRVGLA